MRGKKVLKLRAQAKVRILFIYLYEEKVVTMISMCRNLLSSLKELVSLVELLENIILQMMLFPRKGQFRFETLRS
jgi:hypothetical protein